MRRTLYILAVNLLLLAGGLGLLEIGARARDYGGVRNALSSLLQPEPSRFGGTENRRDWLVTDPDLGYRLNPAADAVNMIGIRAPEVRVPKPPGRFRVIVVGDSVAWDERGFVPQIADRLEAPPGMSIEVINAAIPGYTTFQERTLLERDLLGFDPDLVLVQYCLNDHHRFLHFVNGSGDWLVTEEAKQRLQLDGDGWGAYLTRHSALVRQLRFAVRARIEIDGNAFLARQSHHFGPAWQDEPVRAVEAHLIAMRDAVQAQGAGFAILVPPIAEQLEPRWLDWNEAIVLAPQRRLAAFAEREGIPLLDLHPAFRAAAPDVLFRDLLHFTDRGHEITARELLIFLKEQKLLPDRRT